MTSESSFVSPGNVAQQGEQATKNPTDPEALDSQPPLLTIIIPHKNTPRKLRRLLQSIPSDNSIEVIVIDDNSDIASSPFHLGEEFPEVKFLRNDHVQKNAGSARNCGLAVARGIWLMFADADDYFAEGMLSCALEELARSQDYDCVYFKCTSVHEGSDRIGERHLAVNALMDRWQSGDPLSIRYKWNSPCAKALKRELLQTHNITFDSIVAGNDVIFSTRAGHVSERVRCVDEVLYCITISTASLTANLTEERALARLSALTRHNLMLMSWGVDLKLDFGITYFLSSRPWRITGQKLRVYRNFFGMWMRRISRARAKPS